MKNEILAHWIDQFLPGKGKVSRQARNRSQLRVK